MDYKITRSQLQNGTFVDKWYIKPNNAVFGNDEAVREFFGCTREQFAMIIKTFKGQVEHYRSGFPTKEAAEEAAIILGNKEELELMYSLVKASGNI